MKHIVVTFRLIIAFFFRAVVYHIFNPITICKTSINFTNRWFPALKTSYFLITHMGKRISYKKHFLNIDKKHSFRDDNICYHEKGRNNSRITSNIRTSWLISVPSYRQKKNTYNDLTPVSYTINYSAWGHRESQVKGRHFLLLASQRLINCFIITVSLNAVS